MYTIIAKYRGRRQELTQEVDADAALALAFRMQQSQGFDSEVQFTVEPEDGPLTFARAKRRANPAMLARD